MKTAMMGTNTKKQSPAHLRKRRLGLAPFPFFSGRHKIMGDSGTEGTYRPTS